MTFYDVDLVLKAFVITSAVFVALTVYTMQSKYDFSTWGARSEPCPLDDHSIDQLLIIPYPPPPLCGYIPFHCVATFHLSTWLRPHWVGSLCCYIPFHSPFHFVATFHFLDDSDSLFNTAHCTNLFSPVVCSHCYGS